MKPKILLTGFGPFEGVPVNPTGTLMEKIASDPAFFPAAELKALALETAYARAKEHFEESVAEFQPDTILSFGVARAEGLYRIERMAANRDACKSPDVHGALRLGDVIETEGPPHYPSTLPIEEIETALRAASIPVRFSDSAGNYVCNHIFYSACHWAAQNAPHVRTGFVHIPDPAVVSPDWRTGGYKETLEAVARISLGIVSQPGSISAKRRP